MEQPTLHHSEIVTYELQPTPPVSGKKKPAARLWMRFDLSGGSELLECDRHIIMHQTSIPARDLRVLGPLFSQSSTILAREKAMLINLEFIKAIVTAEEVYLLDPTNPAVIPLVDQLRRQVQSAARIADGNEDIDFQKTPFQALVKVQPLETSLVATTMGDEMPNALPFELRVLEIALDVVCSYLDTDVEDLEQNAYSALDELTKHVSTENLEHIRNLKSRLTSLIARVQKVRDEFEHLLDDDDDMANMYLTRKLMQWHLGDSSLLAASHLDTVTSAVPPQRSEYSGRLASNLSELASKTINSNDVEELEMLLEAYFMRIDGTRNTLLALREYIDDTEDYVNIQLDNQRNQLIQFHLTLAIIAFSINIAIAVCGIISMNIPNAIYSNHHAFFPVIFGTLSGCTVIFFLIVGYARWKELLGT